MESICTYLSYGLTTINEPWLLYSSVQVNSADKCTGEHWVKYGQNEDNCHSHMFGLNTAGSMRKVPTTPYLRNMLLP